MDAAKKNWVEELNMIRPILNLRRRRILIDVGTQRDLFLADGKSCVRNHRRVLANIRRVMAWTRRDNIRVISTVVASAANGRGLGYCVAGTDGTRKLRYTLRHRHARYASDGYTDFPRDVFDTYDQIILECRSEDPFDEPRCDRVLSEVKATDFIVIGAPLETTVKALVLGLLIRRRSVIILTDAVGSLEKNAAEIALRQMQAKGAKLMDSRSLFGAGRLQRVLACDCDRCRGRLQKSALAEELESI